MSSLLSKPNSSEMKTPGAIAHEILHLFERYGSEDYDGEPVSHASHMLQCGMLAEKETGDPELVVGAFLHDIGHLMKHTQPTTAMKNFGVAGHETLGADYLRQRGFSERVCAVVEQHVAAKRYLVATDEAYAGKLSHASRQTLKLQGGPMSAAESAAFKRHPFFNDIIAVRLLDEAAKEKNICLMPLSFFENKISDHLTIQHNAYTTTCNTRNI